MTAASTPEELARKLTPAMLRMLARLEQGSGRVRYLDLRVLKALERRGLTSSRCDSYSYEEVAFPTLLGLAAYHAALKSRAGAL